MQSITVSPAAALAAASILTLSHCNQAHSQPTGQPEAANQADPVLANSAFIVVSNPSGQRVVSGATISGRSRTHEGNVRYRLRGRDGRLLAEGHTTGGSVDGPANFSFKLVFKVDEPELGHLEVFADDPSDGEGFPPPRDIVPLVLVENTKGEN